MGEIMKQCENVIKAMKDNGGFATLGQLNRLVDVSKWATKTPFASIRRIVQENERFFKIRPGLWALTELKDEVLSKFQIKDKDNIEKQTEFNHTYYQGLLLELGNLKGHQTYYPPQDRNKMFLGKSLSNTINSVSFSDYNFTYPEVVQKAKTIDVIWFNKRKMPVSFFEIEHSTNIEHSLVKFVELQDFYSKFYIVASKEREKEFNQNMRKQVFSDLFKDKRVVFKDYDTISALHTKTFELLSLGDI
jgi:hypothetical protein